MTGVQTCALPILTLFIGIILSMFTSLVITRLVLKCFMPLNSKSEKFYGLKRKQEDEEETVVKKDKKTASAATAKEGV